MSDRFFVRQAADEPTQDQPTVLYHGTTANFRKFNPKMGAGRIWFTDNRSHINEAGGDQSGTGLRARPGLPVRVVERHLPPGLPLATPQENDKYETFRLQHMGYHGVKYPQEDGSNHYEIFDPEKSLVNPKARPKTPTALPPNTPVPLKAIHYMNSKGDWNRADATGQTLHVAPDPSKDGYFDANQRKTTKAIQTQATLKEKKFFVRESASVISSDNNENQPQTTSNNVKSGQEPINPGPFMPPGKSTIYHGSSPEHTESIAANGFRPSTWGTLGPGLYASKHPQYADAAGHHIYSTTIDHSKILDANSDAGFKIHQEAAKMPEPQRTNHLKSQGFNGVSFDFNGKNSHYEGQAPYEHELNLFDPKDWGPIKPPVNMFHPEKDQPKTASADQSSGSLIDNAKEGGKAPKMANLDPKCLLIPRVKHPYMRSLSSIASSSPIQGSISPVSPYIRVSNTDISHLTSNRTASAGLKAQGAFFVRVAEDIQPEKAEPTPQAPTGPLEHNPGQTFYRLHHKSRPFSPQDATSAPLNDPTNTQPGYSSFDNPHHLDKYLKKMGWDTGPKSPEDIERTKRLDAYRPEGAPAFHVVDPYDSDNYHVIQFKGSRVGTGVDKEPLAVPHTPKYQSMDYSTFQQRLQQTPGGPRKKKESPPLEFGESAPTPDWKLKRLQEERNRRSNQAL